MNNSINLVIVEDDIIFSETLSDTISEYISGVNIIGIASNVKEGIELINNSKPDLVLLDIELPDGRGFDIIENTKEVGCKFIVLTGNINYAYEAFQNKVFTYIWKLHAPELLIKTLNDFKTSIKEQPSKEEIEFITKMRELNQNMISFNRYGEIIKLDKRKIIYCNSQSNYTNIFINNNQSFDIRNSLQSVLDKVNSLEFVRIHNENVVNMNYISQHKKGIIHKIILSNGIEFKLGRAFKKEFIKSYNDFLIIKELRVNE